MYRTLASFYLSVLVAIGAFPALVIFSPVVQAAEQEKIGAKVGKPMKAAQEAIEKKQWDQALAKIQEANAVDKKTPFEQYQINEFLGYVLLQQKKYGEAAKVFEETLASGRVPANQVQDRLRTLLQLNFQLKNYNKAVEFGERWIKGGGTDPDMQVLVAEAHYLLKDYKATIPVLQSAIQAQQKAGKAPEENWLQILLSSYFNLEDQAGVNRTLEQLVRAYPKPEYWDRLLTKLVRQKNSDGTELNIYRLMRQVNVMKEPEDYMDMTKILLAAGLPGEAQRVMEAGYASKVFDTQDKSKIDRYTRLVTAAKTAAAADRKGLPAAEKEAEKAGTGQADVALGLAYASFEQYDKAVEALARGLQRGSVKDPDQAQMMLGISQVKLGRKADAVKAFDLVKGDPQMTEVARLWALYAKSAS